MPTRPPRWLSPLLQQGTKGAVAIAARRFSPEERLSAATPVWPLPLVWRTPFAWDCLSALGSERLPAEEGPTPLRPQAALGMFPDPNAKPKVTLHLESAA